MRRFLIARYLTVVGWIVLLGAAFTLSMTLTRPFDNNFVVLLANFIALSGGLKLGLMLQARVLARVDPDGGLREQVSKLGADAKH